MPYPANLAAALCAAAFLFAACSLKKAEVSPEREEPAASPTREPGAAQTLPTIPAPASEVYSLEDRLYPDQARSRQSSQSLQPSPIPQKASAKDEKKAKPAKSENQGRHALVDHLTSSLGFQGSSANADAEMMSRIQESPSGNGSTAHPKRGASPPLHPPGVIHDEAYRSDCYRCPSPPLSGTEEYASIYENAFLDARANPLSTFSIDVDGASYSNTRRFLQERRLPPADAVRLEEFINYFDYDYPQPSGSDPFSIVTEVASTPWNPDTKLVHIGLQGRRMGSEKLPPNNLVFLIDVSGSMATPDKLPLLRNGFGMLVDQLRTQDRISIVVYAGAAGMVLPPTSGSEKEAIRASLDRLQAGGSTAGGAGLMLAYQAARESFIKGGNNRVILATDGDFNVGVSSDEELVKLIEAKRKSGVYLSVLGFGTGNLKDSKMEQLADKGNGNYFYIDNINEARKVLVEKMAGTLFAIAKDVKLQIEFNPAQVKAYRLVGYENRMLAAEDFNDDRKDAGELGAGTSVTALYEIMPAASRRPAVDPLKYQGEKYQGEKYQDGKIQGGGSSRRHWNSGFSGDGNADGELLTVKFRYKKPAHEVRDNETSKLLTRILRSRDAAWQNASENYRFSAAAAGFGLILRGSQYRGDLDLEKVAAIARGAKGRDLEGRRAEFIGLVETAASLSAGGQVGYRE